jgi:hypothetical protein
MLKPSRRITGLPSLNLIYYLSAPTMCIVDAIMVPIRLCVYRFKLPDSFSSCLRLVLLRRFAEPDENRETQANKLLDQRHAAFIGLLIMAHVPDGYLRVAAQQLGVNWILCAKVLGVIILASYAVVGILVICSRRIKLDKNPLLTDAGDDDSYQAVQDVEKIAMRVEHVLVMFAKALHAGLMLNAVIVLWPEQHEKYNSRIPHFILKLGRLVCVIGCVGGTVEISHLIFPYSLKQLMQMCLSTRIAERIC